METDISFLSRKSNNHHHNQASGFLGKTILDTILNLEKFKSKKVGVLSEFERKVKHIFEYLNSHYVNSEHLDEYSIMREYIHIRDFIRLSKIKKDDCIQFTRNHKLDAILLKYIHLMKYNTLLNSEHKDYFIFASYQMIDIVKDKCLEMRQQILYFCEKYNLHNNAKSRDYNNLAPFLEIFYLSDEELNNYFFSEITKLPYINTIKDFAVEFNVSVFDNIEEILQIFSNASD